MENTQIQDNGPDQNTVEEQSNEVQIDANNITSAIENLLFGSEQEQQPNALNEGEVQTEDKVEEIGENQNSENPQAEDGEDQVLSQTEEDGKEEEILPNGIQKRINKLTARNKAYEEQISEMNQKLESLEAKVSNEGQVQKEAPRPMPNNPFAHLDTHDKIAAEIENARWLRFKCEENPEGFRIGDSYVTAEEVRTMKVNALKAIEEHLPKQYQHLQAQKHFTEIATKEYPWWNKPETQEAQMANEVLKNFPQFRNFPDFQLFVGDYVRGYMTRTSSKSVQQPIAKSAPTISVKPRIAPSNTGRKEVSERNSYDRFVKSGGKEGLAKLLLDKGLI